MVSLIPLEPVDYLVIGHLAHDLTASGPRLGGTAAYAALTARALGLRVGILTSAGMETSLAALEGIPIVVIPSEHSTTFENINGSSIGTIWISCIIAHHRLTFRMSPRIGGTPTSFILDRSSMNSRRLCRKDVLPNCSA